MFVRERLEKKLGKPRMACPVVMKRTSPVEEK